VDVAFAINQYTVTPQVSASTGSLSPSTPQSVDHGSRLDIVLAQATGWVVDSVGGCGGSLNGNTFTTNPVTADCTVQAAFAELPDSIFGDGFEP